MTGVKEGKGVGTRTLNDKLKKREGWVGRGDSYLSGHRKTIEGFQTGVRLDGKEGCSDNPAQNCQAQKVNERESKG